MHHTRGVLTRVLSFVGGLLLAASLVAVALPAPASAAPAGRVGATLSGQRPDPVADLARQALGALRAVVAADIVDELALEVPTPDRAVLFDAHVVARRALAAGVAARLTTATAEQLDAAWATVEPLRLVVLYSAIAETGTSYRYARSEPGVAFDCSGLTSYAWRTIGLDLVRQSGGQIRTAAPRTRDTALPGDLAWYPGHVMLYLGVGDAVVDALRTGRPVDVRDASRISRLGDPSHGSIG